MSKGIIYVMTTAVSGLIKIGKTRTDQFENRMYQLESNGYSNVVALKRCFAIEVDDYDEKETLLHEIFSKSQVGGSELFALNKDLVIRLLSSFEGCQIYPKQEKKDSFEQAEIASQEGLEGQYFHNDKNGSVVAVLKMVGDKMELNSGMQGSCKRLLNMPSGAVFKNRLSVQKPPVRPVDWMLRIILPTSAK